jgi:hypothetical protein
VEHLHTLGYIPRGYLVHITLSTDANVMLMDSGNYYRYEHGEPFTCVGGWTPGPAVRLAPPYAGRWNIVVDRGGDPMPLGASVWPVEASSLDAEFVGLRYMAGRVALEPALI